MPTTTKKTKAVLPKAMKHQKVSLAHSERNQRVFDCSDPGTGKTFVRIMSFAKRRRSGGGCLLVLAPRSLLRSTWAADFKKFAPDMKVSVATADNRADAFDADADVYITNLDAVTWLAKMPKSFFAKFDSVAIDESSAYKHPTTKRSKAAALIMKYFEWRALMTGTPNSRSITDIWHQAFLLDSGKRLGTSFYAFRNAVCEPTQIGRNPNAIQWKDKDSAQEAVFNLLGDITIRHKFEDCVDIPENHVYTLPFTMPPKLLKAYNEMKQTQLLMLKAKTPKNAKAKLVGGVPEDFHVVSAVNAAVVAGKLLQIASGAVYESADKYHVIDDSRYKMIVDLVEEREHSLVLFSWQHQRDLLIAELESRKIKFEVIYSSDSDTKRAAKIDGYQAGWYQTILGHPMSMAHGYTLTRGNRTIWASPTVNTEHWIQGGKRQHRIGQTQKTETIALLAEGTYDEQAFDLCMGKRDKMLTFLDLL